MTTSGQTELTSAQEEEKRLKKVVRAVIRKQAVEIRASRRNATSQIYHEIQNWANANAASVKACYVNGNQLVTVVFVASHVDEFDENLNIALSDFLIRMNRSGISIDGYQIMDGTPEELTAHFNPAKVIKIQPIGGA